MVSHCIQQCGKRMSGVELLRHIGSINTHLTCFKFQSSMSLKLIFVWRRINLQRSEILAKGRSEREWGKMGLQIWFRQGISSHCFEVQSDSPLCKMKIRAPSHPNQNIVLMDSWEVAQYHRHKINGGRSYILFESYMVGDKYGIAWQI